MFVCRYFSGVSRTGLRGVSKSRKFKCAGEVQLTSFNSADYSSGLNKINHSQGGEGVSGQLKKNLDTPLYLMYYNYCIHTHTFMIQQ